MRSQLTTHPLNAKGARFQRSLDFRFRFIETNAEQIYTFFYLCELLTVSFNITGYQCVYGSIRKTGQQKRKYQMTVTVNVASHHE